MTDTRSPAEVRRQRTSTLKQSNRYVIVAINIAEAAGLGLFTDQVLHRLRRTLNAATRQPASTRRRRTRRTKEAVSRDS